MIYLGDEIKENNIDLKSAIGQQAVAQTENEITIIGQQHVDQLETVNNADIFHQLVENWLKDIYIINPTAMLWDICKQVE